MVDLLVSSNISRYAEFKAVTRILTLIDGNVVEVPVSRGDIFNNKDVSVVDKRMLMKFMTFCAEYERHPEEYQSNYPSIEYFLIENNVFFLFFEQNMKTVRSVNSFRHRICQQFCKNSF